MNGTKELIQYSIFACHSDSTWYWQLKLTVREFWLLEALPVAEIVALFIGLMAWYTHSDVLRGKKLFEMPLQQYLVNENQNATHTAESGIKMIILMCFTFSSQ